MTGKRSQMIANAEREALSGGEYRLLSSLTTKPISYIILADGEKSL
jgi:hypothetical protein